MSLETSKKVLKVSGILGIIFGALSLIAGIMVFATGGAIAANLDVTVNENAAAVAGISIAGGIMMILAGIVALLEGVFSLRGAKNSSKIMPAWVFAILGIVSGAINLISNFGNGASAIASSVVSLLISVLVFVAANTIKKSR